MSGAILVTGGEGQVGTALRAIERIAGLPVIAPTRTALDLRDRTAIGIAIDDSIAAVVNCAAYTDVDGAESDLAAAHALNAEAPGYLAEACNRRAIPLVHLSTDYVFDGLAARPYREDDVPTPTGVYGKSKALGERRIFASGGPHAIVRTAWIVSPWRRNFVRTMIRLASECDAVRVVNDQRGSPTSAIDLADAIAAALPTILAEPALAPQLFHAVNSGCATWFGLASHIMMRLDEAGLRTPRLIPIPSCDYPTPATRPANSVLSTHALSDRFGIAFRSWQLAVDDVVAICLARGELRQ